MVPYCSYCGGRTDGYYEVGGKPCRCFSHCSWCGKQHNPHAEEDVELCQCARIAASLGVEPPIRKHADPTVKWDLTDLDKEFLRSNRIDPER